MEARPLPKEQNADWKAHRCHLLAPPGRRPVDSRSLRLPLDPQAEALGLSVSEALTAAHEKVVTLPHWDVVLVEHPALLDAAGAGWGRCLGTRGEEQNSCDESGARHRASSIRHAKDGAQPPVQVEARGSAQPEGRFPSAALAKLPRPNKRSAVAIREPIVGLGVAGVERQTDAWIVVARVVQAVDRGEADVVLYPHGRLR